MRKNKMNILFCIDDFSGNYTSNLAVTMLSLIEHNTNCLLEFYILSSYLPEDSKNELIRLSKLKKCKINFIINQKIIPNRAKTSLINATKSLTYATFYRLFINNLPSSLSRILYLDCDIIINGDIKSFYTSDFGDNGLIGSYDTPKTRITKKKILGINDYINAGVLLMNLDYIRKIDLLKEILKANKKYGNKIDKDDQDYINIIFENKIKITSSKNNCILDKIFSCKYKNSSIWHLVQKPYNPFSMLPKTPRKIFFYYLKQTKWKNIYEKRKIKISEKFIFIYNIIKEISGLFLKLLFGDFGEYINHKLFVLPFKFFSNINNLFTKNKGQN